MRHQSPAGNRAHDGSVLRFSGRNGHDGAGFGCLCLFRITWNCLEWKRCIRFLKCRSTCPTRSSFLGHLSGIALFVGWRMLLYRRWTNRDEVGANGYADHLFLYVMFLTGLSGMLAWVTRRSGVARFAYVNYFIHIVCVYFLLWYMPYSKFAHMFYRALAIVHARCNGRTID